MHRGMPTSWIAVAVLPLTVGCGLQSEGERCDKLSGDSDCEAPLVCTLVNQVSVPGDLPSEAAICCPAEDSKEQPTTDACFRSSRPPQTDAGSPSPADTTATDAPPRPEPAPDSGPDADAQPGDAPANG